MLDWLQEISESDHDRRVMNSLRWPFCEVHRISRKPGHESSCDLMWGDFYWRLYGREVHSRHTIALEYPLGERILVASDGLSRLYHGDIRRSTELPDDLTSISLPKNSG